MRKMKRVMAIMLLVTVASLCAPQAFAGIIHNPGPDGNMDTPAATGEMGAPGATGDMHYPVTATGIMYPGFTGWIGTGIALLFG